MFRVANEFQLNYEEIDNRFKVIDEELFLINQEYLFLNVINSLDADDYIFKLLKRSFYSENIQVFIYSFTSKLLRNVKIRFHCYLIP